MPQCPNCKVYYRGLPKVSYIDHLWHIQDKNCLKYELMGTTSKIGFALAWLHHYEYEFNESPHPMVNKIVKHLQKYSKSYEWR